MPAYFSLGNIIPVQSLATVVSDVCVRTLCSVVWIVCDAVISGVCEMCVRGMRCLQCMYVSKYCTIHTLCAKHNAQLCITKPTGAPDVQH